MDRGSRSALPLLALTGPVLALVAAAAPAVAAAPQVSMTGPPGTPTQALEINAERIDYSKQTEVLEADGSVVLVQGDTRLTSDHATVHLLTGEVTAVGHVHLSKPTSDVWAERLTININTEAGFILDGQLFHRDTNAFLTAERLQRLSEDRYLASEGSFTNCDVMEGQTPDWRFTYEEVDLTLGESLTLRRGWFCVRDVPIVPIPYFSYPVGVQRKTGLLFPSPGYNTEFGFNYRQSFFWAINPSHDMTITPSYFTERGYGGDLEYRYALGRQNRGQWLVNGFQDTDQDRLRSLVSGSHSMQVNPDLSVTARAFVVSDRTYLQDLGSVGVLRALPSADSYLDVRQRMPLGDAYLLGQFLQPLNAGGDSTFQRLPEVGYGLSKVAPFGGPVLLGFDGDFTNFFREEGFDLNRTDVLPALATQPLVLGHVVSFTPEVRPRVVFYSRGVTSSDTQSRETFWAGLRAESHLTRTFPLADGTQLFHSIQPDVLYEFVPPTDQSQIVQVDDVDDLPKKSLLTYKARTKLLSTAGGMASSGNWLDLTLAQSYRLGATQQRARQFPFIGTSEFTTVTQPLQPATIAVDGKKFSDIWARAIVGREEFPLPNRTTTTQYLTVDTFFDPYDGEFSQVNSDLRVQQDTYWYAQVGQRYARSGTRVRRGDIWNPLSFGEVFEPTRKILFLTASAAVRTPIGWSFGAQVYHDLETEETTELDVVALYQNPCRCWSLGLYYVDFPDRAQFNVLFSLRDIGSTDSFGAQLLKTLLSPLLQHEEGLPW